MHRTATGWPGHDGPDAVHKMRVATRRLRSALASFRPLLDRGLVMKLGCFGFVNTELHNRNIRLRKDMTQN